MAATPRGRSASRSAPSMRRGNTGVRQAQATADDMLPTPHENSSQAAAHGVVEHELGGPIYGANPYPAGGNCQSCDEWPSDGWPSDGWPSDGWSGDSWGGCDVCGGEHACVCDPVGYLLDWSRCDLFAGVTSFASAGNFLTTGQSANGQIDGAFGFQEGFNFGSRAPGLLGGQVGAQIGLRAIQSQLDGSTAGNDARNQLFVTTGLYRRVDYGVQGGLVFDYLHDDGLFSADFLQLRGELSFLLSPCHEIGARMSANLRDAETSARIAGLPDPVDLKLSTLDTYRFFYRVRLGEAARGQAEIHAGFTEAQDGLISLALTTPLQGSVGLAATSTYIFPHADADPTYAHQSWNVGIAIVWTPSRPFGRNRDYYRPLFDVADNGSLLMQVAQ